MKKSLQRLTGVSLVVFVSTLLCMSLIPDVYADQVLSKIETYEAPPYPVSEYLKMEVYDYRLEHGSYVPPTLTDTFIVDLWTIMDKELKLKLRGVTPYTVSEEDVKQVLSFYLSTEFDETPGLRGWTHLNFVRSLSEDERNAMAKEVVLYMGENGVTLMEYEAYDRDRSERVTFGRNIKEGEEVFVFHEDLDDDLYETIESISPEIITTTDYDTGETHTYHIEVSPIQ